MTEQEAIDTIKYASAFNSENSPLTKALKMATDALEKQVPKGIYRFEDDTFETSCCGLDVTNEDYKYCPECGQLLGEVEEIGENEQ